MPVPSRKLARKNDIYTPFPTSSNRLTDDSVNSAFAKRRGKSTWKIQYKAKGLKINIYSFIIQLIHMKNEKINDLN